MTGNQAGKFVTIYMPGNVSQRNQVIEEIADLLSDLKRKYGVEPSPKVPRSRSYGHVFIEQPLDDEMFVYGGFLCDPYE